MWKTNTIILIVLISVTAIKFKLDIGTMEYFWDSKRRELIETMLVSNDGKYVELIWNYYKEKN